MSDIEEIKEKINRMDYWDSQVLDFNIQYFGDEAKLYIQSYKEYRETEFCWEIKFLRCFKVSYETDAGWVRQRKDIQGFSDVFGREYDVKDTFILPNTTYSAQDIAVSQHSHFLLRAKIIMDNMSIDIICQDIVIAKVQIKEQHFFWDRTR
ncbi:hypothetical protein [Streptococcus cuniculi]|uniref:Uncharacterized protein n=1 Tax=Streptococcus cuniculi TaxID=1432788 RepID=A0A4Y9JAJ2_9STRE|nr:hypothetical protein [Streptococcus cuniculi]MBF0778975.1 hypothetical protein [Streptococcus cuniculi]TFU97126.1 hypothetical protein E4T82_09610 [Streptococcus cuniculi]